MSVGEVLEAVARISGRPLTIATESAQKGDMRHTYADTQLARRELGFSPSVDLETGLAAEYAWLRAMNGL